MMAPLSSKSFNSSKNRLFPEACAPTRKVRSPKETSASPIGPKFSTFRVFILSYKLTLNKNRNILGQPQGFQTSLYTVVFLSFSSFMIFLMRSYSEYTLQIFFLAAPVCIDPLPNITWTHAQVSGQLSSRT